MEKKRYRKPKIEVVNLVTKDAILGKVCRAARETNPIGACNNAPQADCEAITVSSPKCQFLDAGAS